MSAMKSAPLRLSGIVTKGFGRGSKMLGIPTANLASPSLTDQLAGHPAGIYFGWASLRVAGGAGGAGGAARPLPVYPAVASIGWNPFFKNKTKTVEPYLLHRFRTDFYGAGIRLVLCGYIRPEADFTSLEVLSPVELGSEGQTAAPAARARARPDVSCTSRPRLR